MKRLLTRTGTSRLPFLHLAAVALVLSCGHVGVDLDGKKLENDRDASASDGEGTKTDEVTETDEGEPTDVPSEEVPTDDTPAETELPVQTDVEPEPDAASDGGLTDVHRDASVIVDEGKDGGRELVDAGADGGRKPFERDASEQPVVERDASDVGNGRDSGTETDPGTVTDGPLSCLAECVCDGTETCDFACTGEQCFPTCGVGAACAVDVGEATSVGIDCAEGAKCSAEGAFAESVEYVCEGGGDCSGACGETSTCSMACVGGGKCTLYCSGATDCTLECGADSTCFIVRQDVGTDAAISCAAENRLECGDVLACAGDCPAL